MFYSDNKTFWYQFCNFKHFLKAENSEDSLVSSCEEFCISFRVTQYETGLLLELGHGPIFQNLVFCRRIITSKSKDVNLKFQFKRSSQLDVWSKFVYWDRDTHVTP